MRLQTYCSCSTLIHRVEDFCYECKKAWLEWKLDADEKRLKLLILKGTDLQGQTRNRGRRASK
jgi:hypothetical protein